MLRKTILALALLVAGCGGATPSPQTVRAKARASVDLAKDAWVLMANACVDAVTTTGDATLAAKCGKPLEVAHDLIVSAAVAVDTNWNTSASCNLENAVDLIASALPLVGAAAPGIAPTVLDAVSAAQLGAGTLCQHNPPADAGAE